MQVTLFRAVAPSRGPVTAIPSRATQGRHSVGGRVHVVGQKPRSVPHKVCQAVTGVAR